VGDLQTDALKVVLRLGATLQWAAVGARSLVWQGAALLEEPDRVTRDGSE
jgi:hypothetical protein